jgi:Zn-dependent peptidase ImmA (M78 family)
MATSSPNRDKAESILKVARIHEAPIDLNKVAASLGFIIEPFPFPDKLKGRVLIKDEVKVIGVNENHPKTLQRYTIAHELGHYLNGHEHIDKTFISDESRYFDSYFHQEKEADAFASELLMPKFLLEKDLSKLGLDIDKLKEKYQVSEQALWIRLTSLRLAEKYAK